VDSFFPVLEVVGERLEELEELVIGYPGPSAVTRITQVKHELLVLRRAVWPQREALGSLYRDPSELIRPETRVYLRDCYDHTIQIIDLLETYREIGSGMMDIYLSSVSNRMNEVMKVLTIIATIFMPLSFLASLYGMNFQTDKSPLNMPELTWRYGYPFALGLMAAAALAMLAFFWRKGWLTDVARRRGGEGHSP
jgi:magnesium transporter